MKNNIHEVTGFLKARYIHDFKNLKYDALFLLLTESDQEYILDNIE